MLPEPKVICLSVRKHKDDAKFNASFLVTIK